MASSIPATSSNVTFLVFSFNNLARDFPIPNALLAPPPIPRIKNIQTAINNNIGNQFNNTARKAGISSSSSEAETITDLSINRCTSVESLGANVLKVEPLRNLPLMSFPTIDTFSTFPFSTSLINVL